VLIFTLIFHSKTNKSYKITLFTTTNYPAFQKNRQKSLFPDFFSFFCSFFPFGFQISDPRFHEGKFTLAKAGALRIFKKSDSSGSVQLIS